RQGQYYSIATSGIFGISLQLINIYGLKDKTFKSLYMKTRNNCERSIKRFRERGEGLIQVLVAVAIIAMIAGSVSSVTVGARDKSVATQLCNAVREIQDAKARFLMDNPTVSETTAATFADLQPYLTAMGVPVTAENQLLAGTGRNIT